MNQPFFVYILRCKDDSYYVGQTDNLDHRIAEHRHGEGCQYTQSRLPVELVWSQEFDDRYEAKETERRLKGWSRAKKEALIAKRFDLILSLASRSAGNRAPFDCAQDFASRRPPHD
jgi:predicted GIY-YIG superfamily endonuclease